MLRLLLYGISVISVESSGMKTTVKVTLPTMLASEAPLFTDYYCCAR
jgi:hypothetical protein